MKLNPSLIQPRRKVRGSSKSHEGPHSYRRILTPNGKEQYLCTLPSCTHSHNIPSWIIGKENRCESCGVSFIINEDKNLKCEDCRELESKVIQTRD